MAENTTARPTTAKLAEENEQLKADLASLKTQMEMLMAMMANNTNIKPKRKDKMITFVNLTAGTLILRGTRVWKIEGQFSKRDFSETEATAIVSNCNNLVQKGYCYILDEDFVDDHNLTESYRAILDVEQMKSLFTLDSNSALRIYKNATDEQKAIIVDMVSQKLMVGEEVDANIVVQLSKLCGKNLMELAPDAE